MSDAEIDVLLQSDINDAILSAQEAVPCFYSLSSAQQEAIVNMAFNLGTRGLKRFRKMIDALNRGDYSAAADEALDSLWASQVGARAHEIAQMIRGAGG